MKHKNGFIKNGSILHLNNQKDFEQYEDTPLLQAIYTYICYIVLNVFGWLRDGLRRTGVEKRKGTADPNPPVCINPFFFNFLFQFLIY